MTTGRGYHTAPRGHDSLTKQIQLLLTTIIISRELVAPGACAGCHESAILFQAYYISLRS